MKYLTILLVAAVFFMNVDMSYAQREKRGTAEQEEGAAKIESEEIENEADESETEEMNDDEEQISDSTDNDWDDFVPEDKGLNFGAFENSFKVWQDDESAYNRPFMSVNFGYADPFYHKPFYMDNFNQIGITELVLGYEKHYGLSNTEHVYKYKTDYFSLANGKSDYFDPDLSTGDINTELWTLAFGETEGYGYRIADDLKISFYSGDGMAWSHLKFDMNEAPSPEVKIAGVPRVFGDHVRFGDVMMSGAKIQLFKTFSIGAEYARNVVFPRHMFWYWVGSEIVEGAAIGILDTFVDKLAENAPYLVPIIDVALKSGIRYGFYELREDDMNWPINTASPFMYESIKATVTLNF